MIEHFDKEEFMKAPTFATIEQEIEYTGCDARFLQPQEQSIMLHIGDRDYDVRDLVYRLLRAEDEVMTLMEKVVDLQTHVRVLEDQMSAIEPVIDYNYKVLEDFLKDQY